MTRNIGIQPSVKSGRRSTRRPLTVVLTAVSISSLIAVAIIGGFTLWGSSRGQTGLEFATSPPSSSDLDEKYCLATNTTATGSFGPSYIFDDSSKIPSSPACQWEHYGYYDAIENTTTGQWTTLYVAINVTSVNETSTTTTNYNFTFTNGSVQWIKEVNDSGSITLYSCNSVTRSCTSEVTDAVVSSPTAPVGGLQVASCTASARQVAMTGYPNNYLAETFNQCATQQILYGIVHNTWTLISSCMVWGVGAGYCVAIVLLAAGLGYAYISIADYYGSPSNSGIYAAGYTKTTHFLWWSWTTTYWSYIWGNPVP